MNLKPTGTQTLEYFSRDDNVFLYARNSQGQWFKCTTRISNGSILTMSCLSGSLAYKKLEEAYQELKAKQ